RRAGRHGLRARRVDRRPHRRCRREPVRPLPGRVARPDRHLSRLHRRAAGAADRPVRSQGMKGLGAIAIVVAVLAAVPLVVHSNTALNFLVITLLTALAGQGWNILGGYGGQYSFGHAAFFGTGAYVTAILQV